MENGCGDGVSRKRVVTYADGLDFTGFGAENVWIEWIKGCLSQRRPRRLTKGRLLEGVTTGRRRVAIVTLGLMVEVWRARTISDSERPRTIKVRRHIRRV